MGDSYSEKSNIRILGWINAWLESQSSGRDVERVEIVQFTRAILQTRPSILGDTLESPFFIFVSRRIKNYLFFLRREIFD
ncbi:hypothetical protein ASG04_07085 [Curtobacterium sp. Leaf183]|nr:hypothetical protein ASG04_07085 [Curtobacterium sp. Leaf183]